SVIEPASQTLFQRCELIIRGTTNYYEPMVIDSYALACASGLYWAVNHPGVKTHRDSSNENETAATFGTEWSLTSQQSHNCVIFRTSRRLTLWRPQLALATWTDCDSSSRLLG
ncbi:MAG: hypothetical protein JWM11_1931, partial [Planctomycetaceae bacterium]|nr:hypothetical protein [Planctomycetaceae bacterium]